MVNFFIDRPIFSTVLAILITLAGAVAFGTLPVARYPQITPPQVVVSANFPGADAATVEQSVAAPIEQQVNGAAGMLYMDSKSSNDGAYSLTVTFEVGTNQDLAAVEVQNKVAVAQRSLPAEVVRNGITILKRQPQPLLFVMLRASDPKYDYLYLSNYATLNVYDALARVPGVGQVIVFGARDYGMRIWLDPEKMARLGVTTGDISAVLNEQNVVAPAGRIGAEPAPPGQEKQYAVSVRGRLSDPAEYEAMVVRARPDGSSVRLRDVARIELAATDYTRSSRLNGEPVATIGVYQLPDSNALDVARGIRQTLAELEKSFPEGINWIIPFDTTPFVSESIHEVQVTFAIAAVLVLLVVFLFLESLRATLIPMLAVPVSIIGSFAAFAALGFSLNTLTLLALVLAIGLVVDDAIVVVEAVTEKMDRHGLSPREATRAAMKDVTGPVIAIALVLTAVFVPVAFLGGLAGQFYRQFALTLSVSVLISAFVALSFIPAMCALLLRPSGELHWSGPMGRFFGAFNRGFERATRAYSTGVRAAIRRGALAMLVFLILGGAAAWLIATRPGGFVPEEDQGYLIGSVTLPPGASLQRTEQVMEKFQRLLRENEEIENVIAITGLNVLTFTTTSNSGTAFIALKPWDERGKGHDAQTVVQRIFKQAAGMDEAMVLALNPPPVPGIGSAGGFEFVLQDRSGSGVERFNEVLQDFLGRAAQRPELARAFSPFNTGTPQVEYVVDRERAKALGVPISDIFAALQTFLGGSYINDFNLYGRTYRVTAQAEGHARATPDAITHLYVRGASGEMIPLSALLSTRTKLGPEYIQRYNIFRAATINGTPAPGVSSSQATQAMEELAAGLPEGYAYEWTGSVFQEQRTGGQAGLIFAMALVFVFLVLAAQYESWVVPFAVLLGIPVAALGAFLGLAARGMANDIYAQIGLVMLIGLAAKNAILIVEFARQAYLRGTPLVEAAIEGSRLRLRPILMTSFAFILGAVPLVIATGAGAAARQVMGTVVVFGMLAATLVGIFLTPVFYVLLQKLVERWRPGATPTGALS